MVSTHTHSQPIQIVCGGTGALTLSATDGVAGIILIIIQAGIPLDILIIIQAGIPLDILIIIQAGIPVGIAGLVSPLEVLGEAATTTVEAIGDTRIMAAVTGPITTETYITIIEDQLMRMTDVVRAHPEGLLMYPTDNQRVAGRVPISRATHREG